MKNCPVQKMQQPVAAASAVSIGTKQLKTASAPSTGINFTVQKKAAKEATKQLKQNQVVQRLIHIGREPDVPNNYRTTTQVTGSTAAHYGGGPFNIHAGVYNSNIANAGAPAVPIAQVRGRSDHSNNALLDRTWASNLEPEIDHIVPVAQSGSNSYSNARILSKLENNNNAAARPGGGNIITRAHHRVRIQDATDGYDNTVAQGAQLGGPDNAKVAAFGGVATVINAASGATNNNVTITET